jgi:TP901 family phage tail tape measure protein
MVNKTEKLNVELELQQQALEKANKAFEDMNQKTKLIEQNMLQVKKTFDSIIKQNTAFQQKFSQPAGVVAKTTSRGSPSVQLLNAEEKRIKANESAFLAAEKQKLRAVRQRVNQTDSLEQAQAKLRAQRERITTITVNGGRLANGRFASLRKEEQAYNEIKTAVDRLSAAEQKRQRVLKTTESIQRSIQSGAARNRSQELLQVGRDHAVARTTGDGGAALFKIQAQLLGNYLIMNKIFQLFNFGTQFVLELDQAFTQLQAITATTSTEMEAMKRELVAVSEQTKFTAVDVAQAATVLGQAGFSTTQIKESIQDVTFLATAVGTDLKSAVDVTTSTLSIFNLRAEETEHVANVLTGAINNSKLTLEKLTLGLQFAGNTAAQAGATFEETVSVLGAMANAGIRSGSTLGTGLRQTLVSFLKPTKKMMQQLESVGLTMEDVNVESNGLINVFETLKQAGFGAANAFEGMQVRAAAAFLAVSNNIDVARELETALLLTNAAAEANEVQMRSLANSLDKFKSILGTLIANLSEPFKDFLITATNSVGALLSAMNKLGAVLPLIGSALIAVGSALFIRRLALMTRNLFKFSNATTVASRATGVLNREVTKSNVLFRNLGKTLKANAPFLVLSGLILAADHFDIFSSKADKGAKILDQFRAAVDETSGAVETGDGKIQSVTERLEKLSKRSATLSNNQHELNLEILKAQVEFGKYGLVIDKTKDPLQALTDGLKELRQEFLKLKGLDLEKLGLDQARLIQQQASNLESRTSDFFGNNAITKLNTKGNLIGLRPEARNAVLNSQDVVNEASRLKNLSLEELSDTNTLDQYITSYSDFREQLTTNKRILEQELEVLKNAKASGQKVNGRGGDRLRNDIRTITNALGLIDDLLPSTSGIQGELFNAKGIASQKQLNSFEVSKSAQAIDNYIQSITDGTAQIRDSLKGVSEPHERKRIVDEVAKNLEQTQEFEEEYLTSLLNPDEMRQVLGDNWEEASKILLSNKVADFNKAVQERESVTENVDEQVEALNESVYKATKKVLENNLKLLKKQADSATSEKALKEIIAKAEAIAERLLNLKLEQANREFNKLTNPAEKDALASGIPLLFEETKQTTEEFGNTLTSFRDKFININDALSKKVDELDKIKEISDRSTDNIDLRLKTLRATISANASGGALEGRYSDTQIRDIEERAQRLEFERLQVQQEALEVQLESTKAVVDRRRQEVAQIRSGPQFVTGEAAKKATEAGKQLMEAEKAQIEVEKQLSMVRAELTGKTQATAEATFNLSQEITTAVNQWNRDSTTIDIGNTIKDQMDTASGALGSFITDVTSGTRTAKDAFKDMARSIIQSMQKVVSEYLANQIMKSLFGSVLNAFAPSFGGTTAAPSVDSSGFISTSGGGVQHFATGGSVRRAAAGAANPNRDSVPILARPGEYVLRNSAVNMIGRENLDMINSMGNRTVSKGVSRVGTDGTKSGGDAVNVYVVSPDQKPQMTAKDVVVTITEDMAKGGPTKKLVKSIQMGKV